MMKIKKIWLKIGIGTLLLLFLCGCTTTITTSPILYTNNQNTDFEILGTVSTRSGNRVGYIDLYNEAKRQYPTTDYVIDIMIDQYVTTISYHWITFAIKQIFGTSMKKEDVTIEYIMRGTAIRYKNVITSEEPNLQSLSAPPPPHIIENSTEPVTSVEPVMAVPSVSQITQNSNYIALSDAGIASSVDGANTRLKVNTTANFNIGREYIDGKEREVVTMEVKLANGSDWRLGEFHLFNPLLIQKMKDSSGVRFTVWGDGKTWALQIPTADINDFCYYESTFSTKKNQITAIDIPYSKLKQPAWGKKTAFNNKNINNLVFQKHSKDGSGTSTIKIFDLEIY